jgi:hypothetical protein
MRVRRRDPQARTWTAWHRATLFAMIALAILAVGLAHLNGERPARPDLDADMIALTVPEFRRLASALIINPTADIEPIMTWSNWRRRHQARARRAHYKRRDVPITHRQTDRGHGRITTRTIQVLPCPHDLPFPTSNRCS